MNRRILKKHCKRAMELLIRDYGFRPDHFVRSRGDESLYVPPGMERRFDRHGFIEPGALKGTWLIFERVSYEYDEWDYDLPTDRLQSLQAWEHFSFDDLTRMDAAA